MKRGGVRQQLRLPGIGIKGDAEIRRPSAQVLILTIKACLWNADRLLNESYNLEFCEPSSSRYFLVMTAQEELAKAFVFYLIREATVPFSASMLRAINDHSCKHLVGVIMDYMIMHWEEVEEMQELVRKDHALGDRLPEDVRSAMELLRYEKVGRWEGTRGRSPPGSNYESSARRIAGGKKDVRKQDSLYIRVGRDGRVCSTPDTISEAETETEFERANRYKRFMDSLLAEGKGPNYRYGKGIRALSILFGSSGEGSAS